MYTLVDVNCFTAEGGGGVLRGAQDVSQKRKAANLTYNIRSRVSCSETIHAGNLQKRCVTEGPHMHYLVHRSLVCG